MARRTPAWRGFRTVLCPPPDFSEPSPPAFRCPAVSARRANARLTVLYVNDLLLVATETAAQPSRHIIERSRRELQAFAKATLGDRSAAQTRTCPGSRHPSNDVLRIAGRAGVDLLVLVTQGLTGADGLLLGSTALDDTATHQRARTRGAALWRPGDDPTSSIVGRRASHGGRGTPPHGAR
jgi:nucleotide-binding universal stress UspA family protein